MKPCFLNDGDTTQTQEETGINFHTGSITHTALIDPTAGSKTVLMPSLLGFFNTFLLVKKKESILEKQILILYSS